MHKYYNQLTEHEKNIIDNILVWGLRNTAKSYGIPLANDDRAEEFVDALSKYILDSRN